MTSIADRRLDVVRLERERVVVGADLHNDGPHLLGYSKGMLVLLTFLNPLVLAPFGTYTKHVPEAIPRRADRASVENCILKMWRKIELVRKDRIENSFGR